MKKNTLINLYWILDAVQKGTAPNLEHVGHCFITIRDELLLPDSEEIVDHIRAALDRQQAAADVLTSQVIDSTRRQPLPAPRLQGMMATLAADMQTDIATADVAVAFGRLVEAAHGIQD